MKKTLLVSSLIAIILFGGYTFFKNYQISGSINTSDASYTPKSSQVQTDWNSSSGISHILNQPSLAGFLTSASSLAWAKVTGAPAFLTGITSSQVTTALTFTPYNATNPSGYITSTSLPQVYVNGTLQTNTKQMLFSGTLTSGSVIFYMTVGGLIGGTGICSSAPSMVQVGFNNSSNVYGSSYTITNSNKTLTITASQSAPTGVISLLGINLLGAPLSAPNGTPITASVVCN